MRSTSIPIALCSLAISIGAQTGAQDLAEPARVVFVCEHGSVGLRHVDALLEELARSGSP
ncbi:MAG: hypothetical protein QOK23_4284 [Gammaproteobacteria bacterium]|jgi:hypothetical protein|nr:hypothetical protein [Gammaproteobacteria bacterium]